MSKPPPPPPSSPPLPPRTPPNVLLSLSFCVHPPSFPPAGCWFQGKFLTKEKLQPYFDGGVKRVVVSAPVKEARVFWMHTAVVYWMLQYNSEMLLFVQHDMQSLTGPMVWFSASQSSYSTRKKKAYCVG